MDITLREDKDSLGLMDSGVDFIDGVGEGHDDKNDEKQTQDDGQLVQRYQQDLELLTNESEINVENTDSLSELGAAAPPLTKRRTSKAASENSCGCCCNAESKDEESFRSDSRSILYSEIGETERFLVEMFPVIRDNLQDPRSVAIKLVTKGKLTRSQLRKLTSVESCRQTHIKEMIEMVIKNQCEEAFLDLLSEAEPDFFSNLMAIRDFEQYSQPTRQTDPRLTAKHKVVIQRCLDKILMCRDVQNIVTKLYNEGIVTPNVNSHIENAPTDSHKMEFIVFDCIMTGTVSQFEYFMSVIEEKNRDVVQSIKQELETITEDEIHEQNILQNLEDEKCMADLSKCLEKTILNAKKGSIILEIEIKTWKDALSIINEANSGDLNDRVLKWLSQHKALTNDQFMTTNVSITYTKNDHLQEETINTPVRYTYCHQSRDWYWTIDGLHWCHISRMRWPVGKERDHVLSSQCQTHLMSLLQGPKNAASRAPCCVCAARAIHKGSVYESSVRDINASIEIHIFSPIEERLASANDPVPKSKQIDAIPRSVQPTTHIPCRTSTSWNTVTDSSGIGSSLKDLTGIPTIRGTIPCGEEWYESLTPEVRHRTELFLEPTSDYDVIFVVGRDKLRVYANSVILKANSELYKCVLQNKDEKGEVHMPDISDSYAFCTFISLLTPIGGKTEDIKDAEIALRVLPLFQLYQLKKRVQICEKILIEKPRELRDLHIAKEYQLKKLEEKVFEWILQQDYLSLIQHNDWSGIHHNTRYEVFEFMLKHRENERKKLKNENETLRKEQQRSSGTSESSDTKRELEQLREERTLLCDFVYDIRDLSQGKMDDIKATSCEKSRPCRHGNRSSHNVGTDRDCRECLSFIVRNVDNVYEFYKTEKRRVSKP